MLAWVCALSLAQGVVELPEGEVLSSLRLRGMGGAITPIAESAAALAYNPAAVAVRQPFREREAVEADFGLQLRDHPLIALGLAWLGHEESDLPYRRSYAQVAASMKLGRPAVGVHWRENSWQLADGRVGTYVTSVPLGWGAGEWAVGVTPQVLAFEVSERGLGFGAGLSAGALWAPDGLPLRLGAMGRAPMRSGRVDGPGIVAARTPAQGALGLSVTVGARNEATSLGPDLDRRGEGPLVVLAADTVLTGSSGDAVALLGLVPSAPTLAAHAGGEAWLARDRVRARLGAGTVPGRGDRPANAFVSAGGAVRIYETPKGVEWRVAGLGEMFLDGPAVGFGFESW